MAKYMGKYVDGFVTPVPKNKVEAYRKLAKKAGEIWRQHGALEFVECMGDDVPDGEVTSFPLAVQLKPGETVMFSWIVFESREERDRINALVMKDPWFEALTPQNMPFDGKRLIFGGFTPLVNQ